MSNGVGIPIIRRFFKKFFLTYAKYIMPIHAKFKFMGRVYEEILFNVYSQDKTHLFRFVDLKTWRVCLVHECVLSTSSKCLSRKDH